MKEHWTSRLVLAGAAVAMLAGCELRPVLASATAERSGESEVIRVQIPTRDAKAIKRRQMKFYLIVSECAGHDGRSAHAQVLKRRVTPDTLGAIVGWLWPVFVEVDGLIILECRSAAARGEGPVR